MTTESIARGGCTEAPPRSSSTHQFLPDEVISKKWVPRATTFFPDVFFTSSPPHIPPAQDEDEEVEYAEEDAAGSGGERRYGKSTLISSDSAHRPPLVPTSTCQFRTETHFSSCRLLPKARMLF